KPVQLRHLDVEEHELRSMFDDEVEPRAPVLRFANECEIRRCANQVRHSLAREAFVVDDQGAQRHAEVSLASRYGIAMQIRKPPPSGRETSSDWAFPYSSRNRALVFASPTPFPFSLDAPPRPSSVTVRTSVPSSRRASTAIEPAPALASMP